MFARFSLPFLIAGAALAQTCPNGSLASASPETCIVTNVNYETSTVTTTCGITKFKRVVTYASEDRDNSILLVADQVTLYPGSGDCIAVSTLLDPPHPARFNSLGKFPLTDILNKLRTKAAAGENFDQTFPSLATDSGDLNYSFSTGTCRLNLVGDPEIVCQYFPSKQLLKLLLAQLESDLKSTDNWTQMPCDTSGPGGTLQCLFQNKPAQLQIVINEDITALTMTLKPIYNLSRRR